MLSNLNIDCENKKLNRNVHRMYITCWEQVCYEILNHESKLLQIKVPLFHVFHGLHESIFLEIYIYVNRETLLIFDWKKHTSNSIWFYYLLYHYSIFLFRFSKGITNMPQVTVPPATANKLQLSLPVGLQLRTCTL